MQRFTYKASTALSITNVGVLLNKILPLLSRHHQVKTTRSKNAPVSVKTRVERRVRAQRFTWRSNALLERVGEFIPLVSSFSKNLERIYLKFYCKISTRQMSIYPRHKLLHCSFIPITKNINKGVRVITIIVLS